MKDIRKQKQLQTQLNTMTADADALRIEIANKQRMLGQQMKDIERMRLEIDKLRSTDELKVSEHAIVRYFERVKGFDIEQIEAEILSEKVRGFVEKLGGNGTYPNDWHQVVMKNKVVITVL